MKHLLVNSLKKALYARKGEPYDYYGTTTRFKPGTRPARMKYIDSEAWDVRNDLLQLQYLKQHFSENDVLWDIGACSGEYAILASTLLRDKDDKIFCFEPDRSARADLEENLALNGLSRSVQVLPVAVSDHSGTVQFVDLKGNANSHIVLDGQEAVQSVTVECVTLGQMLQRLPQPTLVKIDVEGAELRILNTDTALFPLRGVRFLVELHPWAYPEYKADFGQLLQKIKEYGRQLVILDKNKQLADLPCYGSILF